MSNITFNLNNSARLDNMAPAPLAGGGYSIATLPAGMTMAGMYIIVNTHTNNRYIGISSNINHRFSSRLAAVTEMGFSPAQMAQIGVCWGSVTYQNTPGAGVAGVHVAVPVAHSAFSVWIDGFLVNLEQVLIRMMMTRFVGGSISNNVLVGPYINSSANAVNIQFNWGAMGGLFTAAGGHATAWLPGTVL